LHKLSPETEIVWEFKNAEEKKKIVPSYVKCVDSHNKMLLLKMYFSSAVIVINNRIPLFKKKEGQFIIQTWHGDRAFKKVLYDDYGIYPAESKEGFCDLAIAGSEYGKQQYISAFGYKGRILIQGTPRNDILVSSDNASKEEMRKQLGLPLDKNLVLYAPTLRNENVNEKTAQNSRIDVEKTLAALEECQGGEWVCLMRAHPTVCDLCGVEYGEKIINATHYEDMAEILLVSDMLITDYSSCAGDFALLNKPIVLFHSDVNEYLEKDRTFYFDIEESPYYVAHNQQELEAIIQKLNQQDVEKNCKDILDFYETTESGKASETVCRIIMDKINNTK